MKLGHYRKYEVRHLDDPDGKHDECDFFVLDLEHDKHAVLALAVYAESCQPDNPELARDLHYLYGPLPPPGLQWTRLQEEIERLRGYIVCMADDLIAQGDCYCDRDASPSPELPASLPMGPEDAWCAVCVARAAMKYLEETGPDHG